MTRRSKKKPASSSGTKLHTKPSTPPTAPVTREFPVAGAHVGERQSVHITMGTISPPGGGSMNALMKELKQALEDIRNAARFLSEDRLRELNTKLRELVTTISEVRKHDERRS